MALSNKGAPPDYIATVAQGIVPATSPAANARGVSFAPSSVVKVDPHHASLTAEELAERCTRLEAEQEELVQRLHDVKHLRAEQAGFHVNKSEQGEDVVFRYSEIPDLPPSQREALRRLDGDGNGEISLGELLYIEQESRSFAAMIGWLGVLLIMVIGANFLVSLAASIMAQTMNVEKDFLMKKGSTSAIMQTAEAEQGIPVLLSSLLGPADIGRVKEITLSGFVDESNKQKCASCPISMVLAVDVVLKYSDSFIKFVKTNGAEVTIEKGTILVTKVPGQVPSKVFSACGSATCSSIRVNGINLKALYLRAQALGFNIPQGWKRRGLLPGFVTNPQKWQLVGAAGIGACVGIHALNGNKAIQSKQEGSGG